MVNKNDISKIQKKNQQNKKNDSSIFDFLSNNKLTIIFFLLSFYFIYGCAHNIEERKEFAIYKQEHFPKELEAIHKNNKFNANQMDALSLQLEQAGFDLKSISNLKQIGNNGNKSQYSFVVSNTSSRFVLTLENDTGNINTLNVQVKDNNVLQRLKLDNPTSIIYNGEVVDNAQNYIVNDSMYKNVLFVAMERIKKRLLVPSSYDHDYTEISRYKNLYIAVTTYKASNAFGVPLEGEAVYVYGNNGDSLEKIIMIDDGEVTYQIH